MDIENSVNITFGDLIKIFNGHTFVSLNHRGIYGLTPIEIKFNYVVENGKIKTIPEEVLKQINGDRKEIEFVFQNQILDKTKIIIDSSEDYYTEIEDRLNQLKNKLLLTKTDDDNLFTTSIWCYAMIHHGTLNRSPPEELEKKDCTQPKPKLIHSLESEEQSNEK